MIEHGILDSSDPRFASKTLSRIGAASGFIGCLTGTMGMFGAGLTLGLLAIVASVWELTKEIHQARN